MQSIDRKNSVEYQMGYSDGYKEGCNKVMEGLMANIQALTNPPAIVINNEGELEKEVSTLNKAIDDIYNACKNRTFNDCGDLRRVVYDIVYEIVKDRQSK